MPKVHFPSTTSWGITSYRYLWLLTAGLEKNLTRCLTRLEWVISFQSKTISLSAPTWPNFSSPVTELSSWKRDHKSTRSYHCNTQSLAHRSMAVVNLILPNARSHVLVVVESLLDSCNCSRPEFPKLQSFNYQYYSFSDTNESYLPYCLVILSPCTSSLHIYLVFYLNYL